MNVNFCVLVLVPVHKILSNIRLLIAFKIVYDCHKNSQQSSTGIDKFRAHTEEKLLLLLFCKSKL